MTPKTKLPELDLDLVAFEQKFKDIHRDVLEFVLSYTNATDYKALMGAVLVELGVRLLVLAGSDLPTLAELTINCFDDFKQIQKETDNGKKAKSETVDLKEDLGKKLKN